MNKTKKPSGTDNLYLFFKGIGVILDAAFREYQKSSSLLMNFCIMVSYFFLSGIYRLGWHNWDLVKIFSKNPQPLSWKACFIMSGISVFLFYVVFFLILGLPEILKNMKYQSIFNVLGIKNGAGEIPQIVEVHDLGNDKELIQFRAKGVSVNEFENKNANFSTAYGKIASEVRLGRDKRFIEVLLSGKELPKLVLYEKIQQKFNQACSFIVGESMERVITQRIDSLPHLLIAGSTGGGKSNFFRQVVLSLLKNSKHIQFYLLDLKRGIEVVEFSDLPNVRIAKDEKEAVSYLEKIVQEMKARFKYLEENRKKKIVPEHDNKDLIVVAVDEASVLFGKERAGSENKEYIDKARDHIDELAKLARAAGIHLILATQKPVKESIDTKVLENLQGRMAFRMQSVAGSNVALGNKRAIELSDIKGRGIWQNGTFETEVQTPLLTDELLESELESIKNDFTEGRRRLQGEMFSSIDSKSGEEKNAIFSIVKEQNNAT
jgi:S-DNA-T family DNA segregation ATPase FtsK/SpoIIIE